MPITFDKERPLSWSALSSFEYDREQWWEKYCLHAKCTREPQSPDDPPAFCVISNKLDRQCPVIRTTPEMRFGKAFADSVEAGNPLVPVIVQSSVEHPFKAKFGKIELVGYGDSFCSFTRRLLEEYKTGRKEWTQKRADEHGQFDMYLLILWLSEKINPAEVKCRLHWIPTVQNADLSIAFKQPIVPIIFNTKRTMTHILKFGARINRVYKEMEEYAKKHR